jgi:predicted nucleic acid-binding protein
MYLVDTNVVSEARRGSAEAVKWLRSVNPLDVHLSRITLEDVMRANPLAPLDWATRIALRCRRVCSKSICHARDRDRDREHPEYQGAPRLARFRFRQLAGLRPGAGRSVKM